MWSCLCGIGSLGSGSDVIHGLKIICSRPLDGPKVHSQSKHGNGAGVWYSQPDRDDDADQRARAETDGAGASVGLSWRVENTSGWVG